MFLKVLGRLCCQLDFVKTPSGKVLLGQDEVNKFPKM